MSETFFFIVPGRARPKGRPRFGRGGRVFTPPETLEYEARVREAAEAVFSQPLDEVELFMSVVVYIKGRNHADLDNYLKAICDGCNRVAYLDDKQVKHIDAHLLFVTDKEAERVEVIVSTDRIV